MGPHFLDLTRKRGKERVGILPYIELLGRRLPSYGVLGVSGVVLGLILVISYSPDLGPKREDRAYLYVFGAIGAAVGAKIFYLLTVLPQLAEDLHLLWEDTAVFAEKYLYGGMVFYGGMAGALLGMVLSARYFGLRAEDFFPIMLPVFPLVHAVGRVGCFAAGCCYGIPAEWGVVYTESPFAPNGVPLIPVQLFEAAVELGIALFLVWYVPRQPSMKQLLGSYFALYAPSRFLLEFLRGDGIRGMALGLSTSQWISMVIFGVGIVLICRPKQGTRQWRHKKQAGRSTETELPVFMDMKERREKP